MYRVLDGDQNRDVGASAVTRVKMGVGSGKVSSLSLTKGLSIRSFRAIGSAATGRDVNLVPLRV